MSDRRLMLVGTATNYLKMVVRILVGVVTYRLIYAHLPPEDFAVFQLLWGVFGFAVLLDGGFGFAIQKAAAEATTDAAREAMHRAISTVFWLFGGIAAVVTTLTWIFAGHLLSRLHYGPAGIPAAHVTATVVFAGGSMLGFWFGIYRELLRGQRRFLLLNGLDVGFMIANGVLIAIACTHGGGLITLLLIGLGTSVGPLLGLLLVACRDPACRPHLAAFEPRRISSLAGFSFTAWTVTALNTLMASVDQIAIAALVSVDAVQVFNPALKVVQTYSGLALQMPDLLGPLAARRAAAADPVARQQGLQELLTTSQRWMILIVLVLAVPVLAVPEGLLQLLTGMPEPSTDAVRLTYLLLAGAVGSLIGGATGRRILMMTGHHHHLMRLTMIEAFLHISVTVGLLWWWRSLDAAAWGPLLATLVQFCLVMPFSIRAMGLSVRTVCAGWARTAGVAVLPSLVVGVVWAWWHPFAKPIPDFLACAACVAAVALPMIHRLMLAPDQRQRLAHIADGLRRRVRV